MRKSYRQEKVVDNILSNLSTALVCILFDLTSLKMHCMNQQQIQSALSAPWWQNQSTLAVFTLENLETYLKLNAVIFSFEKCKSSQTVLKNSAGPPKAIADLCYPDRSYFLASVVTKNQHRLRNFADLHQTVYNLRMTLTFRDIANFLV